MSSLAFRLKKLKNSMPSFKAFGVVICFYMLISGFTCVISSFGYGFIVYLAIIFFSFCVITVVFAHIVDDEYM